MFHSKKWWMMIMFRLLLETLSVEPVSSKIELCVHLFAAT